LTISVWAFRPVAFRPLTISVGASRPVAFHCLTISVRTTSLMPWRLIFAARPLGYVGSAFRPALCHLD
jgi:hypothetical protein